MSYQKAIHNSTKITKIRIPVVVLSLQNKIVLSNFNIKLSYNLSANEIKGMKHRNLLSKYSKIYLLKTRSFFTFRTKQSSFISMKKCVVTDYVQAPLKISFSLMSYINFQKQYFYVNEFAQGAFIGNFNS